MTLSRIAGALLAASAITAMALPATASEVFSTGYDMPNGNYHDGIGSGHSYGLWDGSYVGPDFTEVGSTRSDHAYLHGGSGALTDGVISTAPWETVTAALGGPYVGWNLRVTPDPLIVFYFDGSPTITGLRLWIDNSQFGGANSPQGIDIDGHTLVTSGGPAAGSQGALDFTGLNLTGGRHVLQLYQDAQWLMVSEIQFFSDAVDTPSSAPEPASWALMIAGLGVAGAALRRRRATPAC